jgi:NAD(P)-dependent dehydrogenase (short-subunit alcohol dehydrogenase family)
VHNAGVWPTRLEQVDGLERAFALNCLSPLWLQAPLLAAGCVSRILLVSAGLLIKGKFKSDATPIGADFSAIGTYCATKLAGAAAMRELARKHPEVDIAVVHPGVVNTDLGARTGPMGWLLRVVKRRWETPEVCAARLQRILDRPRWQRTPGEAPWLAEEEEETWPEAVERDQRAVVQVVTRLGAFEA